MQAGRLHRGGNTLLSPKQSSWSGLASVLQGTGGCVSSGREQRPVSQTQEGPQPLQAQPYLPGEPGTYLLRVTWKWAGPGSLEQAQPVAAGAPWAPPQNEAGWSSGCSPPASPRWPAYSLRARSEAVSHQASHLSPQWGSARNPLRLCDLQSSCLPSQACCRTGRRLSAMNLREKKAQAMACVGSRKRPCVTLDTT